MRVVLYMFAVLFAFVGLDPEYVSRALMLPSSESIIVAAVSLGLAVYMFLAASKGGRPEQGSAQQVGANSDQRVRERQRFALAAGTLVPAAAFGIYASFDVFRTDMPFMVLAIPYLCGPLVAVGLPFLFIAHGIRHARLASASPLTAAQARRWAALAVVMLAAYTVVFSLGWGYASAASRAHYPRVTWTHAVLMQAVPAWVTLLLVAWLSPGRKWSVAFTAYLFLLAVSLCVSALASFSAQISTADEALRLWAAVTLVVTPVLLVLRLLFGSR